MKVLVDVERERVMEGWVPRRLGRSFVYRDACLTSFFSKVVALEVRKNRGSFDLEAETDLGSGLS